MSRPLCLHFAYYQGHKARDEGRPCLPPHGFSAARFWWVGGWNDRDIECHALDAA